MDNSSHQPPGARAHSVSLIFNYFQVVQASIFHWLPRRFTMARRSLMRGRGLCALALAALGTVTWAVVQSCFVMGSSRRSQGAKARSQQSRIARRAEGGVTKIEVCVNRHCKLKGGAGKLKAIFDELAPGTGIEIVEKQCLDECPMGPNVRLLRGDDDEFGDVINGVKGKAKVAELLGVELPELE
eukprot:TRINITY_DN75493_c0_g1_i1.p1 TRINITY_DN75493_c0_g1~~TRINITY_DN75493_c0_g1_i1.p1  ORF type:complete len:185 (+),score=45.90 TRINITY_DN75493_c0_g1_i1:2-556(+)